MMLQLILLSICSSLDNFVVGLSLGLRRSACTARTMFIVAAANAAGAVLASHVGAVAGERAPAVAGAAAGLIFLYLAAGELQGWLVDEPSSLTSLAEKGVAWRLAVPMTLNNLAGGVAGGLTGIGAASMGLGALVASYALMDLGHRAGELGSAAVM
ncbi:hypothetical protein M885DRAFT_540787 [Pelagophyceae sp. CCMP2097]|nr:hypothetical protein M885DRAFT_540787 [Pelagophyceae sp. CCMP2097]